MKRLITLSVVSVCLYTFAATQMGGCGGGGGGSSTTGDTTAPTVFFSPPSATLASSGPVLYTVTYGGADTVTLSSGDVSLDTTGTATASIAVSGSGLIRLITLSSITGDGTLGVTISAGTASDIAGNTAAAATSETFTVDNTAPVLAEVVAVPALTNDTTPNYTFSSTEAGAISYGGSGSSSTTGAASGNNVITFNALAEGMYSNITVTVTDAAGNASAPLSVSAFTVDTTPPQVSGFAIYTDENRNFQCDAGDKVVVTFDGSVTVAGAFGGDFSLPVDLDSLGSGATVAAGASSSKVEITLGATPRLKTRGTFSASAITANSSSGIDASGSNAAIMDAAGNPATPSTPVDLFPGLVDSGQTLSNTTTRAVALGDVDGDGDLDLVLGNDTNPITVWLNTGGTFTNSGQSLNTGSGEVYDIELGDVDGDGLLDLVVAKMDWVGPSGSANQVWWNNYLGAGVGVFTKVQDLPVSDDTISVALGDLDGDGDLDLVVGNYSNEYVQLWRNNLSGSNPGMFSPGPSINSSWARDIALGDVDNDGDLDIVVGRQGTNIAWLNDGSMGFPGSQSFGTGDDTVSIALADLDGDGDLDLVAGNQQGGGAAVNRVFRNDGVVTGTWQGFTNTGQSLGNNYTSAVAVGDLDGDGDLDLVEGNYGVQTHVWVNDGSAGFTYTGHSIGQTSAGNVTSSLALGDVDGDGDLDLVDGQYDDGGGPDPTRIWFGSLSGTWGEFNLVATSQTLGSADTREIILRDIDNDGDLDAIVANETTGTRVWINNQGVFTDSNQTLANANAIALEDLDGDGDLDLFTGGTFTNDTRMYWNDYLGAGPGTFTDSGQNFNGNVNSVALSDIDSDGDLDVLFGRGNDIQTWTNNGSGIFGSIVTYAATGLVESLALGDLDGDGDLDMVAGIYYNFSPSLPWNLVWFNDGTGTFVDSFQTLGDSSPGPGATKSIALGDIDGDGDLDLVAGNDYEVATQSATDRVYENNGSGTFSTVAGYGGISAQWTALAEMNGDGRLDWLVWNYDEGSPSAQQARIFWNDGEYSPTWNPFAGTASIPTQNNSSFAGAVGDIDGDGDLDVVDAFEVWINQ